MNRSLSIHPLSALLGLVFGVLVLLSMSQTPPLNARNVNVQYLPDPRDYVQIKEGAPFTVPPGKLFVLTGLGSVVAGAYAPAQLSVNGTIELTGGTIASAQTGLVEFSSVALVPQGLTATSGSSVEVNTPVGIGGGRAWGFLATQ